jgi:hypothetical protein
MAPSTRRTPSKKSPAQKRLATKTNAALKRKLEAADKVVADLRDQFEQNGGTDPPSGSADESSDENSSSISSDEDAPAAGSPSPKKGAGKGKKKKPRRGTQFVMSEKFEMPEFLGNLQSWLQEVEQEPSFRQMTDNTRVRKVSAALKSSDMNSHVRVWSNLLIARNEPRTWELMKEFLQTQHVESMELDSVRAEADSFRAFIDTNGNMETAANLWDRGETLARNLENAKAMHRQKMGITDATTHTVHESDVAAMVFMALPASLKKAELRCQGRKTEFVRVLDINIRHFQALGREYSTPGKHQTAAMSLAVVGRSLVHEPPVRQSETVTETTLKHKEWIGDQQKDFDSLVMAKATEMFEHHAKTDKTNKKAATDASQDAVSSESDDDITPATPSVRKSTLRVRTPKAAISFSEDKALLLQVQALTEQNQKDMERYQSDMHRQRADQRQQAANMNEIAGEIRNVRDNNRKYGDRDRHRNTGDRDRFQGRRDRYSKRRKPSDIPPPRQALAAQPASGGDRHQTPIDMSTVRCYVRNCPKKGKGHLTWLCPSKDGECDQCGDRDHSRKECERSNDWCSNCTRTGHTNRECPYACGRCQKTNHGSMVCPENPAFKKRQP